MKLFLPAGIVFGFLIGGCSDGSGDVTPPERVSTAVSPLSNHEHCDTAPRNAVIDWRNPAAMSPIGPDSVTSPSSTYDSSSCAKAYLVDVWSTWFPLDVTVDWAGVTPATAADCTSIQILAYTWEFKHLDDGPDGIPGTADDTFSESYLGALSQTGIWHQAPNVPEFHYCSTSVWMQSVVQAPSGSRYRFGISARRVAADGSYATRPVSLKTKLSIN